MEQANISLCLICLGTLECPKNLFDDNCKKLWELLFQLLGFQVEIEAGIANICGTCEGKLVWVDEFKSLCLKSLEKFKSVDCKKEFIDLHEYGLVVQKDIEKQPPQESKYSDNESSKRPKRRKREIINNRFSNNTRSLRKTNEIERLDLKDLDNSKSLLVPTEKLLLLESESESSDDESSDTIRRPKTRRKVNKRPVRVKKNYRSRKYSEEEVLQAITECENYMTDMKNRKCLHCDYEAPNAKSMWIHMPLKHKEEYKTWCKHCNLQMEDLQSHKDSVKCFEERCKFCNKLYPNKNVLLLHLRTHCENNLIEEIKKKTRNQYSKDEVLQAIASSTKYMTDLKNRTCSYCTYIAPRAKTLAVHIKRRHRDCYDTWCSRCNLQTDNLKAHLNSTKCFESTCPLCDKKYTRINRLTIHIKSHCRVGFKKGSANNDWDDEDDDDDDEEGEDENGFPFFDDEENTSSINVSAADDNSAIALQTKNRPRNRPLRKTHRTMTESMKSYNNRKSAQISRHNNIYTICPICKKKVRSIRSHNLTKHKTAKVKTKSNPGSCNKLCTVCGKLFKNNQLLTLHMRKHNGLGEKSFKCSYCEKQFPNKCYLRDHERRHTGEKPYVCHICGRGFVSNGEQKCHMKIHEGGPVQCTICNKEFSRPGVLELHMKRHTGENPFNCIECGMSYHRASLLKNHMRSHSNERPFKCSFCDKYFSCKSTLRKHERIHKGIKPYKCSVCSFSCTQAHGLSSHMKQHPEDPPQPDRPYKCLFCYRQFDTNAMLMSHTNNQHQEQANRKE